MHYYFSIILAIGIATLNSPNGDLYQESIDPQASRKSQLVTQVTSTNDRLENNQPELPVDLESETKETTEFNQNLLLSAIAVTSIFTAILLFLLFKKVEINLNEEKSDHQEDDSVDDQVTLEVSDSLQTNSENNHNSSVQQQSDDTVLVPRHYVSHSNEQEQSQDTVLVSPDVNFSNKQQQSQDKVLEAPDTNLSQQDLVAELILKLPVRNREIRPKTISELAQNGDSRAMIPLVELMIEADSQERILILDAMKAITTSLLKPLNQALISSLGDENSQVKQNAIRDLTRIYEVMSQVTEVLSQTINNSDGKLPETAQWALQQLKQMPETPTSQLTNLINK